MGVASGLCMSWSCHGWEDFERFSGPSWASLHIPCPSERTWLLTHKHLYLGMHYVCNVKFLDILLTVRFSCLCVFSSSDERGVLPQVRDKRLFLRAFTFCPLFAASNSWLFCSTNCRLYISARIIISCSYQLYKNFIQLITTWDNYNILFNIAHCS